MVSDGGGSHAEWSRDGKQLYYLAADKRIMAVARSFPPMINFSKAAVNALKTRWAGSGVGREPRLKSAPVCHHA
jgi:hypothetical protein